MPSLDLFGKIKNQKPDNQIPQRTPPTKKPDLNDTIYL